MVKVLLAVGQQCGSAERRFFRKAMAPFIEKNVADGRKVVVIHELALDRLGGEPISLSDKTELVANPGPYIDVIQQSICQVRKKVNAELSASLNQGRDSVFVEDMGFNRTIKCANTCQPGSVLNVIEPQSAEAIILSWRLELLGRMLKAAGPGCDLDLMAGIIITASDLSVKKDRLLAGFIESSAELNGKAAFAIPSSAMRKGLARLLSPRHDVRVMEASAGCPRFVDMAAELSYERELSRPEIEDFARKELEMRRFMEREPLDFAEVVLTSLGYTRKVEERRIKRAVEHVNKNSGG